MPDGLYTTPYLDKIVSKVFKHRRFDDSVDRLNYCYTAALLLFFASMVSLKQYVGTPIQCVMPIEFKSGWDNYVQDLCFMKNTYFVAMHKDIPDIDDREKSEIGYYQWTSIVLILQALLFFVPNWAWSNLHKQSGMDLPALVEEAMKLKKEHDTERREKLEKFARNLDDEITMFYDHKKRVTARKTGWHTSALYLSTKALYLTNIIVQFIIMNRFLGSTYTFWGISTLSDLYNGREWTDSGVFPRVTLCDFTLRKFANVQRFTVQCALVINMFNEKIYLVLWFWFLFVGISTLFNALFIVYRLCTFVGRKTFVKSQIIHSKIEGNDTEFGLNCYFNPFIQNGLQIDGVLMLYFINAHSGSVITKEITTALYNLYLKKAKNAYKSPSTNTTADQTELESPFMKKEIPKSLDLKNGDFFDKSTDKLMVPDYPGKMA